MNPQPNTPASLNEAVATINGEPATAHSLLAALVDIHDDQKNAPEDRCYVESAWGDCMRIARAFLASAITPEPSLKERADALMAAGHAFWQACRRDAGGGAVRWLKATDGTAIIFTRGEYAGTLLSAIGTDYQAPEIVFEQPVGDDDMGGIVASIAAPGAAIDAREQEVPFGIIDPDYARYYTLIRTTAWQCGYAIGLHGSFTRDLDLIAVPWTAQALPPDLLIKQVEYRTDLRRQEEAFRAKPHGRMCWSLLLPGFTDPRWIDLSVMPALASREEAPTPSEALSPATVAQPVEWGDPKTVGMFIRQLQTIAPETPIHAAVHTDIDGKRVALTKPVTISRERVQGRRIRQGDQSVPYSIVVWASHDEAAQPCASQGCGGAEALHAVMKGVEEMLVKAHEHWDADREMKVGKILLALTGENKGYDKRSDAWCAALSTDKSGDAA